MPHTSNPTKNPCCNSESDIYANWLTSVLHDASKVNMGGNLPEGPWSSPALDAHDLLWRFSSILSSHEDTPPAVLTFLSKFDHPAIQERVAEHPNTPMETLIHLVKSPCSEVRGAIADNPNASSELLQVLVCDEHPDVRHRVAENCNLAAELLSCLCEDENPYVAMRAQKSLHQTRNRIPEGKSTHKFSVLIVDDDDVTRLILSLALKTDPLMRVVGQASSGANAIQMARSLRPDIILMDIGMPNMNGIMATSLIKKELPNTKVVMVTAHDKLAEIVDAFGNGAEGYHLKSSSRQDLGKALRVVASDNLWLDPGIVSTVLRELTKQSMPILQRGQEPGVSQQKKLSDPVQALMNIVEEYANDNKLSEARHICQSALTLSQQLHGDSPLTTATLNRLADLYFQEQEYSTSEATYLDLIRIQSKLCQLDDPALDDYLGFLSDMYEFRGNVEQAELFASWHVRVRENLGDPDKLDEARRRLDHILKSKSTNPKVANKVN